MYKYFLSLLNTFHKRHFPTRCESYYSKEFCEATNHLRYRSLGSDEYYASEYVYDINSHGLQDYDMTLYHFHDSTQWRVGKFNKIEVLSSGNRVGILLKDKSN